LKPNPTHHPSNMSSSPNTITTTTCLLCVGNTTNTCVCGTTHPTTKTVTSTVNREFSEALQEALGKVATELASPLISPLASPVDSPLSTPSICYDTPTTPTHECCICYDTIDADKNNCVTDCGHRFCFKCVATSLMHNNCACPYCRAPLVDTPEESEEDDEEEEDDDETLETEDEADEDDDETPECDIDELVRRLIEQGIGMKEVLSMLIGRYSPGTTDEAAYAVCNKFDEIVEEADREVSEQEAMWDEDTRNPRTQLEFIEMNPMHPARVATAM